MPLPGHIRAYDSGDGSIAVILFHTIPQPGEFGHDTWQWVKGENYGCAMPGAASPSMSAVGVCCHRLTDRWIYGAFRKRQAILFGNCVIALDATARANDSGITRPCITTSGTYDNPPAPILATSVTRIHVRARFAILEARCSPLLKCQYTSDVPARRAFSHATGPAETGSTGLTAAHRGRVTNISPEARAFTLQEFRKYKSGPLYSAADPAGHDFDAGPFWGGRSGTGFVRSDLERSLRKFERTPNVESPPGDS